jgi:hypothetical protein
MPIVTNLRSRRVLIIAAAANISAVEPPNRERAEAVAIKHDQDQASQNESPGLAEAFQVFHEI